MRAQRVLVVVAATLATLGSAAVGYAALDDDVAPGPAPATTVPATASSTTTPATVPATSTTATPALSTTTTRASTRVVTETRWTPFAIAGDVTLVHPAARVERVGFHQSNHEGARHLDPLPTAVAPTVLEARERLTDGQTAADVVVEPDTEIRSPVTGKVKRAGTYTLYCKYHDDYAVIAPDANPAWEVKLLHIDRVAVHAGQRVTAGETPVARRATVLPFVSQVDELRTADPAWPHVHIEVVDPSIRNVPSPGGGC